MITICILYSRCNQLRYHVIKYWRTQNFKCLLLSSINVTKRPNNICAITKDKCHPMCVSASYFATSKRHRACLHNYDTKQRTLRAGGGGGGVQNESTCLNHCVHKSKLLHTKEINFVELNLCISLYFDYFIFA